MAKRYTVAVIGGGIIGCLTAWQLKRLGAHPIVLERGRMGQESSWAGAGILCPIHPWLYPDSFTHLIQASLDRWPTWQQLLNDDSGMSVEWKKSGLMIPFFPDDQGNHRQAALEWSSRFGWQVESLDTVAAQQAEPALADDVAGALVWPEVSQIRNPRLLQAVGEVLRNEDVDIREKVNAVGIFERGGRVCGVELVDGRRIDADAVLIAAGSWSGSLAKQLDFSLPVKPVKGQIMLLKSDPGRLRHIIKHDMAYFVPRCDGHILVGASMEDVGFKRGNTVAVMRELLNAIMRLTPELQDTEIEKQWMGFRPGSPDGLPFIGPVAGKPGLWISSGHYRNGVALAPITAEIISHWILGEEPDMDMSAFLPDRDIKASKLLGYPE